MTGNRNSYLRFVALMLLALSVACSNKDESAADTTAIMVADTAAQVTVAAAPGAPVALSVATKPGVGVYLTDAAGRAVYVIDDGTGTTVACTGACATEFTAVSGSPTASSGTAVKADLIGVTTMPDGTVQVTYAGKPLYYAAADQGTSTSAQAKKSGNNTSYLVNPNGNRITSRAN